MGYNIINPKVIKPDGEVSYKSGKSFIRYEWKHLDKTINADLIDLGFTHFLCRNFDNIYTTLPDGRVNYTPTNLIFAVKMLKTTIIFEDGQRARNIKVREYAFS